MWTAENACHTYLHIMQNTNFIRKSQVIPGGGGRGGVHSPCTPPRSAPESLLMNKAVCKPLRTDLHYLQAANLCKWAISSPFPRVVA